MEAATGTTLDRTIDRNTGLVASARDIALVETTFDIFEILPLDDKIQELVVEEADATEIKREAVRRGMRTLRQSALRKLAAGVTSFEEVVRVTGI